MKFEEVLHLIEVVLVAAGVVLAWWGLRTWRKELRAGANFELARRLMVAVYRVKYAMVQLRSSTAQQPFNVLYDKLIDSAAELNAAFLESDAMGWNFIDVAKTKIRGVMSKLNLNLKWARRADQDEKWREGLEQRGKLEEINNVVWSDGEDLFGQEIENAVKDLETHLRPYLEAQKV
jgi:hypothetical protein